MMKNNVKSWAYNGLSRTVLGPKPAFYEVIKPKGVIADKFQGAEKRCVGLSIELEKIADEQSTLFFDSTRVTEASTVDGIHLDEDQHHLLGEPSPVIF